MVRVFPKNSQRIWYALESNENNLDSCNFSHYFRQKELIRKSEIVHQKTLLRSNFLQISPDSVLIFPIFKNFLITNLKGMDKLDDEMVSVMQKRVYDIAGCNSGLKVSLNGKVIAIKVTFAFSFPFIPLNYQTTFLDHLLC